jgi:DNA-binding response OmpR family regulator
MTLPDMSGLNVVRRIRDLPQGGELPVIGVTGHVGTDQADLCRDAGCTGFVEKPVRWDRLGEQLETLLVRDEKPAFLPMVEELPRLDGSSRGGGDGGSDAGGGPPGAAAAGD